MICLFSLVAGFTGFCVGLVNNRLVYIPITTICDNSPRVMDPAGRCVRSCLEYRTLGRVRDVLFIVFATLNLPIRGVVQL